jgi:hypothetical protein
MELIGLYSTFGWGKRIETHIEKMESTWKIRMYQEDEKAGIGICTSYGVRLLAKLLGRENTCVVLPLSHILPCSPN